jgi:hypothetical protein
MKRSTKITVFAMLICGLAVGIADAQFTQESSYIEQVVAVGMRNPSARTATAPVMQNEQSVNYEQPASAGYSSRPIGAVQPLPGPALARTVQRNSGSVPDTGMAPARRMSKCKPDQAGACGPQPYPAPYAAMRYGPPPPICGPVCVPAQVNWY